jgi:hypothetical protein
MRDIPINPHISFTSDRSAVLVVTDGKAAIGDDDVTSAPGCDPLP